MDALSKPTPLSGSPPAPSPAEIPGRVVVPPFLPAVHTVFPPPPRPPAVAAPAPQRRAVDLRGRPRIRTPQLHPVSLSYGGGTMAYATLRDISPDGACLARRGPLDLAVGTPVQIEIHQPGSDLRVRCRAQVRWCRYAGFNTYIGLSFRDGRLPRGSFLDPLLSASA